MPFAKIRYAYASTLEATASLALVAAVEWVCSLSADDPSVVYFARYAAGAFLIAASLVAVNALGVKRNRARRAGSG